MMVRGCKLLLTISLRMNSINPDFATAGYSNDNVIM